MVSFGLGYNMRMRKALEIRKHKCGPGSGLNKDMGAYVKTDIWDTVLNAMGKWCSLHRRGPTLLGFIFLFSFSIVLSTHSFVSFPFLYLSVSLFSIILAPDDETQSSLENLGKYFTELVLLFSPFSFPSLHVFGISTIFLIFHFIMRLTLSQDQRPGTTADVPDNIGFLRVIFH